MTWRLFAASLQTTRMEEVVPSPFGLEVRHFTAHTSTPILAQSKAEAMRRAMELVKERFPSEGGWIGHHVSVTEIPATMIAEVAFSTPS